MTVPATGTATMYTDTKQGRQGDLNRLAGELTTLGFHAMLRAPVGKQPYLQVSNPQVTILTGRIFAEADFVLVELDRAHHRPRAHHRGRSHHRPRAARHQHHDRRIAVSERWLSSEGIGGL